MTKYILIYFIIFVSSVYLIPGFDYAELKRYYDLPKRTWAISDPEHSARVILVPLFSRFGPILRTFRPLLSQCSTIVRSFSILTIPLSFFKESKAVLASTIIFFEDTSCYQREWEPLCEQYFECIFVLRNTSGPRMTFVDI